MRGSSFLFASKIIEVICQFVVGKPPVGGTPKFGNHPKSSSRNKIEQNARSGSLNPFILSAKWFQKKTTSQPICNKTAIHLIIHTHIALKSPRAAMYSSGPSISNFKVMSRVTHGNSNRLMVSTPLKKTRQSLGIISLRWVSPQRHFKDPPKCSVTEHRTHPWGQPDSIGFILKVMMNPRLTSTYPSMVDKTSQVRYP